MGLGYGCSPRVSIIVTRCIKVAKNSIQQRRAGLAERSRAGAGAGEAVVLGSNPAWIFGFFFFSSTFEKFLSFLAGYYAGTRSAKFSVPVPVR